MMSLCTPFVVEVAIVEGFMREVEGYVCDVLKRRWARLVVIEV
jgi:hypothetical protein